MYARRDDASDLDSLTVFNASELVIRLSKSTDSDAVSKSKYRLVTTELLVELQEISL